MKKTFLIIISLFFILSCENENFDENIDTKISNNDKSGLEQNRFTPEDPDILALQLRIVAYITGRVLLNNPNARSIVLNQLQGRDSISYNELFYPYILDDSGAFDRTFLTAFEEESQFYEGRPTSHRPIPPITIDGRSSIINHLTKKSNLLFSSESNNKFSSYSFLFNSDSIHEFVETGCFELYFARKLNFTESNHLYICNHPLIEEEVAFENGFTGFDLWTDFLGAEAGEYILFDEVLLNTSNISILVVRPYVADDCFYENIKIDDFTEFYRH